MGPPPDLFAELSRWRHKAEQRGKGCEFTSEIIPDWLNAELMAAQEVAGVDAFSFLKASPAERRRRERELAERLEEELAEFQERAAKDVEKGKEPDYAALALLLGAILTPFLQSIAVEEAMRVSVEMGIAFDPAVIGQEATRWAREYGYDLIRGLTDTTRNVVSEAMQTFTQNPEMGREALQQMLQPAFGQVRAQMIAATETTRAYSEATNEYQQLLSQAGIQTRRRWITREDERVCPACGPLHNLTEDFWAAEYPSGPPIHPNCRCELQLEYVYD